MEFRTIINIEPSGEKITYNDPVLFIGSCFATALGKRFITGHMPVMINPAGTVYNPFSVANTLEDIISEKHYTKDDLFLSDGKYVSFNHYSDFSSEDPDEVLAKINFTLEKAFRFLIGAKYLFITFGTARVYRWNESGRIVSNCHKIPEKNFTRVLLSKEEIVKTWYQLLDKVSSLFPALKIIFTISPVRHMKDGAHGNQVSKAVLFLALEELLKHRSCMGYFPAYELVIDELRDYRFYDNDMIHPSPAAVDYIWERFTECYFDDETSEFWREAEKISKGFNHVVRGMNSMDLRKFAAVMLEKIKYAGEKIPSIDFSREKEYFRRLE